MELKKISLNEYNFPQEKNYFKYFKILFIIIIITFFLTDIIINIGILNKKKIENMFLNIQNDLYVLKLKMKSFMNTSEEFNEIINEEFLKKQNYFCENQSNYYNYEFEKKIKLEKVNFNNINFNMFIYKNNDIVSNYLSTTKVWEKYETDNIIKALKYFSRKKNVTEKDIYIIDVGGNVGWYTFSLGNYGYKIMTFEPSQINFYILSKNYCLNKGLNITLINKGLFPEEKKCYLYSPINNIGNGFISCKKSLMKK